MIIVLIFLTLFCFPALAESAENEQSPQVKQSMPLAPDSKPLNSDNDSEAKSRGSGILPTLGAIVIVAGAFLLVLWLLKKTEGSAGRPIPDSVVKTLGKTRIGAYPVFLVSVGKKLVLVSASSNSLTPLTEITDPVEADAIRKAISGENGGGK